MSRTERIQEWTWRIAQDAVALADSRCTKLDIALTKQQRDAMRGAVANALADHVNRGTIRAQFAIFDDQEGQR